MPGLNYLKKKKTIDSTTWNRGYSWHNSKQKTCC